MHVFLTGATGFIGRHLVPALLQRGDACTVVSRSPGNPWNDTQVTLIAGDPTQPGPWQGAVAGADAVVNLAGERLVHPLRRWTRARKGLLVASRVNTTRLVAAAIRAAQPRPRVLVSGSAVGYYGDRGDEVLEESSAPGDDFLAQLALAWERTALEARDAVRVAVLRTGLVMARDAPVLMPLLPVFRLGLGGSWGNGRGWWSWIHIADLVALFLLALDQALEGAVNATAPNPVRVDEFAFSLGSALRRPVLFRMPAVGLRLAMGEAADALLHLQRVMPARALSAGFTFRFPTLREALEDLRD